MQFHANLEQILTSFSRNLWKFKYHIPIGILQSAGEDFYPCSLCSPSEVKVQATHPPLYIYN